MSKIRGQAPTATRETGSHQRRFASTRCLTIPARVRAMHPYPCGVKPSRKLPSRHVPSSRSRAAGTSTPRTKKRPLTRRNPSVGVQRIAARLVQRMPWLDRAQGHLMGLSRGLAACGVTGEWTTQDLMNAVERDHQGLGLLSLPPDSQKNPRALLLHQIKRAITGKEPPARARRAVETARREARAAEIARPRRRRRPRCPPGSVRNWPRPAGPSLPLRNGPKDRSGVSPWPPAASWAAAWCTVARDLG